jgi:hypothetical protein
LMAMPILTESQSNSISATRPIDRPFKIRSNFDHLVEFGECEAFVHQEALHRPTCIGQFGVRRGNAKLIQKRKAQNGENHANHVDSRQRTRIRRVSQPVIPTPKRLCCYKLVNPFFSSSNRSKVNLALRKDPKANRLNRAMSCQCVISITFLTSSLTITAGHKLPAIVVEAACLLRMLICAANAVTV